MKERHVARTTRCAAATHSRQATQHACQATAHATTATAAGGAGRGAAACPAEPSRRQAGSPPCCCGQGGSAWGVLPRSSLRRERRCSMYSVQMGSTPPTTASCVQCSARHATTGSVGVEGSSEGSSGPCTHASSKINWHSEEPPFACQAGMGCERAAGRPPTPHRHNPHVPTCTHHEQGMRQGLAALHGMVHKRRCTRKECRCTLLLQRYSTAAGSTQRQHRQAH